MNNISDLLNLPKDFRTYAPSAELPSNADVGIEIELERCPFSGNENPNNNFSPRGFWNFYTGEGSLRNHGLEFISQKVRGQDIIFALNEMNELLSSKFKNKEVTERCGLHVHVDISDLSLFSAINFIKLSILMEPLLIALSGNRTDNPFCVPIYNSYHAKTQYSHFINWIKENSNNKKKTKANYRLVKYTSINCAPAEKQGSVEFRMHEGTANCTQILMWVRLLLSIRAYAEKNDVYEIDFTSELSAVGVEQFLTNIFAKELCDYYNILIDKNHRRIFNGMRSLQEVEHLVLVSTISNSYIKSLHKKKIEKDKHFFLDIKKERNFIITNEEKSEYVNVTIHDEF